MERGPNRVARESSRGLRAKPTRLSSPVPVSTAPWRPRSLAMPRAALSSKERRRPPSPCSLSSPWFPLSRARLLSPYPFSPRPHRTLTELAVAIAGVPSRRRQIAWSRSSASSSSTTSPSLASWSERSSPPSSLYRSYIDGKPSSIPATSSPLRPHRPTLRLPGELAQLANLFPLSPVLSSVDTFVFTVAR